MSHWGDLDPSWALIHLHSPSLTDMLSVQTNVNKWRLLGLDPYRPHVAQFHMWPRAGKQSHGGHLKVFSTIKSSIWHSPETWSCYRAFVRWNLWVFTMRTGGIDVAFSFIWRSRLMDCYASVTQRCQRTNVCLCACLVCVHLHLVMLKRFPFPVALTDRVDDREKEREGAGWGLLCILGGLLPIVGKLNIYIL